LSFYIEKTKDNNEKAELNAIASETEINQREEIASLNRSLQQNKKNEIALETHFIQSSDVVPFLDALERLAPLSGVKAKINSVDVATANSGLIVGLEASGNFQEIYKFLTLLENSPYEIDFLSMDVHALGMAENAKALKNPDWEAVFRIQLLSFIQ